MLNFGLTMVPNQLDPVECWNYQQFLMIQAVYDTLVRVDENGRLVSGLAKKWHVNESGTTYTFFLDSNAKFHNGMSPNSEDVAFSIARHLWPDSKSVVKNYLIDLLVGAENLKTSAIPSGIKIEKPDQISLTISKPYPPFLFVLAMPGFSIVPKNVDFKKGPIGSGPMTAKFLENEATWVFERFPSFSGTKPKAQKICIKRTPSLNDVLDGFKNQSLDVAIGPPFSELDGQQLPTHVTAVATNSLVTCHLIVNKNKGPLSKLDFRRDLASLFYSLAEKKENLSKFQDFEPTYIPKGVMPKQYYDKAIPRFDLSSFKAKYAGKEPIHIVLLASYFKKEFLDALDKLFVESGLNVKFDKITNQEFGAVFAKGDFDVLSLPYIGNFPDPDGFLEALRTGDKLKDWAPGKQLFEEIDKIRHTANATTRLAQYSTVLQKFEGEWFVIPLFRVSLPILHREGIKIPETNYRYEANLRHIFWEK